LLTPGCEVYILPSPALFSLCSWTSVIRYQRIWSEHSRL